ncbi:MAG: WG repeat-containing protein [Bacteroidetes bacterium]|nr:WG repeat-containing protein [Bacteroidota bacterium]MBS1684311.1 WG repeat-containing protein [Bacteroidota bacterium]
MLKNQLYLLPLAMLLTLGPDARASKPSVNYLVVFCDEAGNCGYKDHSGQVVIPPGKYAYLFTDTFYNTAIVQDEKMGIVAIDRQERPLYKVFVFDKAPEYASEGLYRIYAKGKFGFASLDQVVIPAKFDFVYPFSGDYAVFVSGCRIQSDVSGQHIEIIGGKYGYIDHDGKVIKKAAYESATSFENGKATVISQGRKITLDKNFNEVAVW